MESKDFKYAIRLRYSDEDGVFIARAPELPGCTAHGSTPEKAIKALREAAGLWIEIAREEGRQLPRPNTAAKEYNGTILARVPAWLHRTLDEDATESGVSLNQHIVALLAVGCGAAAADRSGLPAGATPISLGSPIYSQHSARSRRSPKPRARVAGARVPNRRIQQIEN